jgi:KaiC/GvpD/RAD55 family RecA-like ATPase
LVSTGLGELDRLLGKDGYPDKSTILVVGPPGIGKEALGYWFMSSGLAQSNFCLYVTRFAVSEVKQDMAAFRANEKIDPFWFSTEGGQVKLDINDLLGISVKIKEALKNSGGKQVRIVMDVLSSLLMLNPPEVVYRFLTQLFAEIKANYDSVILTVVEEGMHPPQVLAAMQQLFDGVVELRLYRKGELRVVPLLRIVKMRGLPPQSAFFHVSFSGGKMELKPYA